MTQHEFRGIAKTDNPREDGECLIVELPAVDEPSDRVLDERLGN